MAVDYFPGPEPLTNRLPRREAEEGLLKPFTHRDGRTANRPRHEQKLHGGADRT
jgi:hypothetical protein